MVGTQDPNYQTLAGLGPDIFGVNKGGGGEHKRSIMAKLEGIFL